GDGHVGVRARADAAEGQPVPRVEEGQRGDALGRVRALDGRDGLGPRRAVVGRADDAGVHAGGAGAEPAEAARLRRRAGAGRREGTLARTRVGYVRRIHARPRIAAVLGAEDRELAVVAVAEGEAAPAVPEGEAV